MPFTPFHFGPGLAVKAIVPKHFSFCTFALTQVVIDVEALTYMLGRDPPFHRIVHTYIGATAVAAVCFVVGKPAGQLVKAAWNRTAARCTDLDLALPVTTTWLASLTGAVIGAYSHIFLDSIVHRNMVPMYPWSHTNGLFMLVGPNMLKVLCVGLGLAGTVEIGLAAWNRKGD